MRYRVAFLALAAIATLVASPTGKPAPFVSGVPAGQSGKSKPASRDRAFSGCVDQQDGRYVLLEDRTLNRIAELQAVAFPQEGFAKHLGQKVTVRGEWAPDGKEPMIKVRSITTLRGTCEPEEPKQ